MKVVVCGGRKFKGRSKVFLELDFLHLEYGFTELMQGGCLTGVDHFTKAWGRTYPKIISHEEKADWDRYGRAAGPIRNQRMVEWGPDLVIAFPGGKGTANMVAQATRAGLKVIKVLQDG